jgi:hypothetical protein
MANIKRILIQEIIRRQKKKTRKRKFTCIEYVNNHNMQRGVYECVNVYLIYNVKSLSAVYWKKKIENKKHHRWEEESCSYYNYFIYCTLCSFFSGISTVV